MRREIKSTPESAIFGSPRGNRTYSADFGLLPAGFVLPIECAPGQGFLTSRVALRVATNL